MLQKMMSRLPPLNVPKKQIGRKSANGAVELPELPDSVPGKIELGSLTKQTADLLQVGNIFVLSLFFSM